MEDFKAQLAEKEEEVKELRWKANEATKVVEKIWNYIGNLGDVVNKAKLFDKDLRKVGSAFGAKIINVLVHYLAKMERILNKIKVLSIGL